MLRVGSSPGQFETALPLNDQEKQAFLPVTPNHRSTYILIWIRAVIVIQILTVALKTTRTITGTVLLTKTSIITRWQNYASEIRGFYDILLFMNTPFSCALFQCFQWHLSLIMYFWDPSVYAIFTLSIDDDSRSRKIKNLWQNRRNKKHEKQYVF